jgi:transcriptional regulator with XRE-family HTH domain
MSERPRPQHERGVAVPPPEEGSSNTLGAKIRAARRKAGLTQASLAELMGVRQSSISQWERGHTRPSLEHLVPLAAALGVSLDGLLNANSESTGH